MKTWWLKPGTQLICIWKCISCWSISAKKRCSPWSFSFLLSFPSLFLFLLSPSNKRGFLVHPLWLWKFLTVHQSVLFNFPCFLGKSMSWWLPVNLNIRVHLPLLPVKAPQKDYKCVSMPAMNKLTPRFADKELG